MKHLFLLLLLTFLSLSGNASLRTIADSLYEEQNYIEAQRAYTSLIEKGEDDATVYYNLGNANYRLKKYADAVLCYERALKRAPALKAAKVNLAITQTKIADKFSQPEEMFFVSGLREIIRSSSPAAWGAWSVVALVFSLIGCGLFFLCDGRGWRLGGIIAAVVSLTVCILLNLFAAYHSHLVGQKKAVVFQPTYLYSSPSRNSEQLRPLHEGTTLLIEDLGKGQWLYVSLPDETEGWIFLHAVEQV